MPGTVPLTIVSFTQTVQMCASLMNTRPIVILPPSLSDPDELMTVSPSSLCGPSDSSWTSLGAGGDYRGQQALQASLLKRFRKYWKLSYTVKWPNGWNQWARNRRRHVDHWSGRQLRKKQPSCCTRADNWFSRPRHPTSSHTKVSPRNSKQANRKVS